jgi:hypothetical protein
MAKLESHTPARVTFLDVLRAKLRSVNPFIRTRRPNMTWILIMTTVVSLLAGGGVIRAADGAAPGDPLYGLDRAIETIRLKLTKDPPAAVELQLEFVKERLLEAEKLVDEGDGEHLGTALGGYGEEISDLARTVGRTEEVDRKAVTGLLDKGLSPHEVRPVQAAPSEEGDPEDGDPEEDEADSCVSVDPHPVGQSLADAYDTVDYEQAMEWFCEGGYGFGEIILALKTSEQMGDDCPLDSENGDSEEDTGCTPGALLELKTALEGWGEVWQELGLIGQPDEVPDDAGPPEDAGPPDDAGPPEGVPPGPPDGAGPPEGVPPGPPDDAGPPEDAGPPDDVGPPEDAGPPPDAGPPDDVPPEPPDEAGPPDDTS